MRIAGLPRRAARLGLAGSLCYGCEGPRPAAAPAVAAGPVEAPVEAPAETPAETPVAAPAAAPPRWVDLEIEGDADWVAFRSETALLVARQQHGGGLGVAEFDVESKRQVALIGDPAIDAGPPAAWSAATSTIAFASAGGVIVRSLAGGAEGTIGAQSPSGLAFSPKGDRLALTRAEAGEAAWVEIYEVASGRKLSRERPFGGALPYDSGSRLVPAFVGEGLALLLANDTPPGASLALRAGTGKQWRRVPLVAAESESFAAAPALGLALAVSPEGRWIAAGNCDQRVHLLQTAEATPPTALPASTDEITALAFAPDGAWLAAGGEEGPLRVLTPPEGRTIAEFEAPPKCGALAVSPEGRRIAGGCAGAVRIWSVTWPPGQAKGER